LSFGRLFQKSKASCCVALGDEGTNIPAIKMGFLNLIYVLSNTFIEKMEDFNPSKASIIIK
jgi:hypothetical protein